MLETSSGTFTVLEDSSEFFHGAGDLFWGIFTVLENSMVLETSFGEFHGAGDFFGGIFMVLMLETSSGEFHSAGDFFGGIFTVLEDSLGGFSLRWILLLENSLEGFSHCWRVPQCWRLLWRDFQGAGDFFWDFHGAGDFWRFSRC